MGIIKSKATNKAFRDGHGKIFKERKMGSGKTQKASPRLLPKHMRDLPSNYVTDDDQDGKKVHELDPDHVVGALVEDLEMDEFQSNDPSTREKINDKAFEGKEYEPIPINQERVDWVRVSIILAILDSAESTGNYDDAFKKQYVWFPDNDVGTRELRQGNPPSNSERPKHLQNIELWLDPLNLPRSILDQLKENGLPMPDINDRLMYNKLFLKEKKDGQI